MHGMAENKGHIAYHHFLFYILLHVHVMYKRGKNHLPGVHSKMYSLAFYVFPAKITTSSQITFGLWKGSFSLNILSS